MKMTGYRLFAKYNFQFMMRNILAENLSLAHMQVLKEKAIFYQYYKELKLFNQKVNYETYIFFCR